MQWELPDTPAGPKHRTLVVQGSLLSLFPRIALVLQSDLWSHSLPRSSVHRETGWWGLALKTWHLCRTKWLVKLLVASVRPLLCSSALSHSVPAVVAPAGVVLRVSPRTCARNQAWDRCSTWKKCKVDPAGSGIRGRDSSQVTLLLTVKADDLKEVSSLPQVKSGKHSHFGWSRKRLASFCLFRVAGTWWYSGERRKGWGK